MHFSSPQETRWMKRFRWPAAAALHLTLGFISGAPLLSQNPNGFIQRDQWACLLPLHGSDCTGGGEEAMKESWISPHDLAEESPVGKPGWELVSNVVSKPFDIADLLAEVKRLLA